VIKKNILATVSQNKEKGNTTTGKGGEGRRGEGREGITEKLMLQ